MRNTIFAAFILIALTLVPISVARACPLCAEAIANSSTTSEDEERNEFPLAMNRSIYLMISVPYIALGLVGFLIYRGVRKNQEFLNSSNAPASITDS